MMQYCGHHSYCAEFNGRAAMEAAKLQVHLLLVLVIANRQW